MRLPRNIAWVAVFGVAFAFVESSVVVYLRSLYYPGGFSFPLRIMSQQHLHVELAREAATIVMLVTAGILAGTKRWERFGYFLVGFGVWDIFYYVWLKVVLDWPSSFLEWDILFLIPVPWIGPVIAPVLISLSMIVFGVLMVARVASGKAFRPTFLSWLLSIGATVLVLYSFMMDPDATSRGGLPAPYRFELLAASFVLLICAFIISCRDRAERNDVIA
jgi:hypothetical protein